MRAFLKDNSKKYTHDKGKEHEMCSICMIDFSCDEDALITELSCNNKHIFHLECITKWVENNDTCPLCREPVLR